MQLSHHPLRGAMHRAGRLWRLAGVAAVVLGPAIALGGGGAENALIVIDPRDAESLYLGNYYKSARGIPDRNVLYMAPGAADYLAFVGFHIPALHGTLAQRIIDDHIDYIIVPPGSAYRISARNLISDGCSQVRFFSASSVYTMAHIVDDILQGQSSQTRNEYFSSSDLAIAFDSNTSWRQGMPSGLPSAKRYFIGAMLGFSGTRGNTLEETISMIDRSVAADGMRPDGTFYYMKTTDPNRSGPRDPSFPAAIASLIGLGASAEQIDDVLPIGRHDALGIMTGWASPDIEGADMTLVPGSFCDHLTSYAGHFANQSQRKMSRWIAKGASGSAGTVEEPCNYPGKFPHPRMHVYYFQGLSLGEATSRSLGFVPYQVLLYGDPLTQPFAYLPVVSVDDAPVGEVSGFVTLTPTATTDRPGGAIGDFDLLIDGIVHSTVGVGEAFEVDTAELADGMHDIRVIAFEDSLVATQGRWLGTMEVNNLGRFASVTATPSNGDLSTSFSIDFSAGGGTVIEIRLMQNGRVLAAAPTNGAIVPLFGDQLGAGVVELVAVAEFDDGRLAFSAPEMIDIAFTTPNGASDPQSDPELDDSNSGGSPAGASVPVAYSYTLDLALNVPTLIDLPATDADGDDLTIQVVTPPSQGVLLNEAGAWLLIPDEDASDFDSIIFKANDGVSDSNQAKVTIQYCPAVQIVDHPVDQDACVGEKVVLEVVATGPELLYQWFKNDLPIPGATDSILLFDPVGLEDEGRYLAEVTNFCGTVRSDSAVLSVLQPVEIVDQPVGATVCTQDSWIVFVIAGGAETYQWFKDGEPIAGENDFFLIIDPATPSDGGSYTVEVANLCGSIESDPAVLEVEACGFGDGDLDNDADFGDFGLLQECYTGPDGSGLSQLCALFDFDGDDDVDSFDVEDYLLIVTGPQ